MAWKIVQVPTFLEAARGDHPGKLKGIESSSVTVLVALVAWPGWPPPGRVKGKMGISRQFLMELQENNVFSWNFSLFGHRSASVRAFRSKHIFYSLREVVFWVNHSSNHPPAEAGSDLLLCRSSEVKEL